MSSRATFAIAAWTATAFGAVGAGLAAISALGAGITDQTVQPMTSAQVEAALAKPLPTTPHPSSTPDLSAVPHSPRASHPSKTPHASRSPRASRAPRAEATSSPAHVTQPAAEARSLKSEGGTVLARCELNLAYLVSWTPVQGYNAHDAKRGPAVTVSVEFESDDREILMLVSCRGGRPYATARDEEHEHHEGEDDEWEHH